MAGLYVYNGAKGGSKMNEYVFGVVFIVTFMVYELVTKVVERVTREKTKRVKEERRIMELTVELERLKLAGRGVQKEGTTEAIASSKEAEQGEDQRDGDQA